MGKYGSGISMKEALKNDMREIMDILARSDMPTSDKKVIIDTFKELSCQWCSTNAHACAYEKLVPYDGNTTRLVISRAYNDILRQKMEETYPWHDKTGL